MVAVTSRSMVAGVADCSDCCGGCGVAVNSGIAVSPLLCMLVGVVVDGVADSDCCGGCGVAVDSGAADMSPSSSSATPMAKHIASNSSSSILSAAKISSGLSVYSQSSNSLVGAGEGAGAVLSCSSVGAEPALGSMPRLFALVLGITGLPLLPSWRNNQVKVSICVAYLLNNQTPKPPTPANAAAGTQKLHKWHEYGIFFTCVRIKIPKHPHKQHHLTAFRRLTNGQTYLAIAQFKPIAHEECRHALQYAW